MFARILITLVQTKFNFTFKAIKIDFSKINPVANIKNLFTMQKFTDLIMSVLKLFFISILSFVTVYFSLKDILSLPYASDYSAGEVIINYISFLERRVVILLIIFASVDYLF